MPGPQAYPNRANCAIPTLSYHRTRSIETYTQTVTEIWVGYRLTKILVTDTSQHLETKIEFVPAYSVYDPRARELTAIVNQVKREYVY